MSNPPNNLSNEAERQWWCIEFEFSTLAPDGAIIWATPDHDRRDCPDCQRSQPQCSTQPKNQPQDTDNENV